VRFQFVSPQGYPFESGRGHVLLLHIKAISQIEESLFFWVGRPSESASQAGEG
jgi:hypothetical protein